MRITTARIILRDFVIDDCPDVLAYQRDPRYLRFYPWADRKDGDARDLVQMFLDQQEEQPRRKFQFAITLPDRDKLIGNCGIRRKLENAWEADIGCELAPEDWGQGYARVGAPA